MMTSDAKRALAKTIRELREKIILPDLREAIERAYQLAIDAKKATLSEAARIKREDAHGGVIPFGHVELPGGVIRPLISRVRDVRIAGKDLRSPQEGVGISPTVQWDAPAIRGPRNTSSAEAPDGDLDGHLFDDRRHVRHEGPHAPEPEYLPRPRRDISSR